ncbi:MAG: transposase, partial [Dethiobacter sp.]|nr:transposase [Dethiobacter sp.]
MFVKIALSPDICYNIREVIKQVSTNKGRGYVYNLKYHIVFCVKYRHQILEGQIKQDLKDFFLKLAEANGFQ